MKSSPPTTGLRTRYGIRQHPRFRWHRILVAPGIRRIWQIGVPGDQWVDYTRPGRRTSGGWIGGLRWFRYGPIAVKHQRRGAKSKL